VTIYSRVAYGHQEHAITEHKHAGAVRYETQVSNDFGDPVHIAWNNETMIRLTFYRIRPGQLDRLKAWFAEAEERADEVRETFIQEGVSHEQAFLLETNEGLLLVYAVECEDYDAALEAFSRSKLPIDMEHKKIVPELTDGVLELTPLLDIRRL
jgi:hypothetical protein